MRLLIGSSSPPDKGSGINAYVRELSESLFNDGHEIHFCSPPPDDYSWLEKHKLPLVESWQHSDPFKKTNELIKYVYDKEIDGIINNDNALLQNVAPAVNCPFISIGHMSRTSVATLACYQHQWTDHVVAISNDMQSVFVQKYGVPVTKCPIVYSGVSNSGLHRDELHNKAKELVIIFAGGYSNNKGSNLVEQAVIKHNTSWEAMNLHWFGAVPKQVMARLKPFDFVTFHGRVTHEDFIEALRNADILLLPSVTEGCPMVMLEAMSYGVIPIASDGLGAMRHIVTSGYDGFICHLRKWPEQQMQCLDYLLHHPERLLQMKQASFNKFKQNFQIMNTAQQLIELLNYPTVDRSQLACKLNILRWHRPFRPDHLKAPIIDRIAIRLGWLRKAGILEVDGKQ